MINYIHAYLKFIVIIMASTNKGKIGFGKTAEH